MYTYTILSEKITGAPSGPLRGFIFLSKKSGYTKLIFAQDQVSRLRPSQLAARFANLLFCILCICPINSFQQFGSKLDFLYVWPLKKNFIVPDLILPAFLAKSSITNNFSFSLHSQSVSKFSSPQSPLLLIFLNPNGHLISPESSLILGWPVGLFSPPFNHSLASFICN